LGLHQTARIGQQDLYILSKTRWEDHNWTMEAEHNTYKWPTSRLLPTQSCLGDGPSKLYCRGDMANCHAPESFIPGQSYPLAESTEMISMRFLAAKNTTLPSILNPSLPVEDRHCFHPLEASRNSDRKFAVSSQDLYYGSCHQ